MVSLALSPVKSLHSYNPIPGGCVLYLPLWNPGLSGTTFKSIDPYGHECTKVGALYQGDDGAYFDGIDDKITVAATTWGVANAWSFYMWVKPFDTTTLWRVFWSSSVGGDSRIALNFNQNANTELRVLIYDGDTGVNNFYKDYRKDIITTDWQLLTFTWDGTNLLVYRNAALQTMTKARDDAMTMADNSRDFVFGQGANSFFKGNIPEHGYYDNAHAQGEVTYWYNQTRGRYA